MDWKIHKKSNVYDGHFKVAKFELTHELFAGGETQLIQRECISRQDAVALVPYDPDTNQVVLVEQFRVGAIREAQPWLKEIVAGLIEQNEDPAEVAMRESVEEIGCMPTHIKKIGQFYTTPGGFSELIHLYVGRVDVNAVQAFAGLEHEGEDIKVQPVSVSELNNMLSEGEIRTAIGIIGLQWLLQNYQELQQAWLQS